MSGLRVTSEATSSVLILGKRYGVLGTVAGYLAVTALVFTTWSVVVFVRKRREWHTGSA